MKRLSLVVFIIVLFAGAYWWFARQEPPAPPAPPPPPAEDTKVTERRELFGEEALAKEVEWRSSGLGYRITNEGTPPKPGIGAPVRLKYVGRLRDGKEFDRADKPRELLIGAAIPGLSMGLQMLGTGGKATFYVPPSLGYGHARIMGIPPDSGLIFDVEVVEIGPR